MKFRNKILLTISGLLLFLSGYILWGNNSFITQNIERLNIASIYNSIFNNSSTVILSLPSEIKFIQSSYKDESTGGSSTYTKLNQTLKGDTIIACFVGRDVPTKITDDKSNIYKLVSSIKNSSSAGYLSIYYATDNYGGATQVSANFPWGPSILMAAEYSGIDVLDSFVANDSGYKGGSKWDSGKLNTSSTNELLVGCATEIYGS